MSKQIWEEVLPTDGSSNGATNTSGAEAIMFPDFTLPAGYMNDGRYLRYTALGKFSNVVTTPGSITFRLRFGGLAGTLVAQSSAIPLNIVAQTDIMFQIVLDIISRGNGTAAPILAMGVIQLAAQLAANNNQPNFMGSAGGASGNTPAAVNVDTTVNQALSLTYQSTVATGSMTGMMRTIESLN